MNDPCVCDDCKLCFNAHGAYPPRCDTCGRELLSTTIVGAKFLLADKVLHRYTPTDLSVTLAVAYDPVDNMLYVGDA